LDPDHIRDLFATFGPVAVRRMFGGVGLFADDVMFALVAAEVIYLKADDRTIPAFQSEGLGPFTYDTKNGKHVLMSYWRMPDRLYDEPDELARWARDALEAARRSAAAARPKRARRSK